MIKRILAVLMILIIVISLSGCTKDNKEGNDRNTNKVNSSTAGKGNIEENMGRYMEQDIELPELNGQENIIRVLQNTQKKFEAYTQSQSEGKIYCYTQKEDKTWEKSEPGWLNTKKIQEMNLQIMDICCGEDGNYYACYQDYSKSCSSVIVKASPDGKVGELMDMPYLTKVQKVVDNTEYCSMVNKIGVLKSGNIIISDAWSDNKLIILSSEGKKVDSIDTTDMQNFLVVDNHIILTDKDNKVCLYNTETKSNDQSITYKDKNKNEDMYATPNRAYAIKKDGTLFIADSDGIHRMNQNGTLWETTVDGALNSMNMPSLMITGLYVTEGEQQEEYYVVFTDDTAGYQVKHYVFDKTVPTIPKKEITVYSLKENKTIRQAISLFQAQNADVKINYMVAMGEEEGNVTDYIRALNTELLSGKGADVILLDGLPIDSYIEKGVLADITDLAEGINKDGNILPNIYENYNAQGKVYRLPIRFNVPMIIGKQEAVDASNSLTDMANYIRQSGKQYYDKASYQMLLKDNLALYYKDICNNGILQQEKLKEFLVNVKTISDNCKATETLDQYTATGYSNGKVLFISDDLFRNNYFSIGTYEAGTMQMSDIYGFMIPNELAKDKKLKYSIMNQHYIPKGLVGLNKASKETDLAKSFISFLFTAQVQDTNLYDGLPVNTGSLKKWFDQENPDISMGTSDDKGNMIVAYWPAKQKRTDLLNEIEGVNTPIEINQVLFNMIIESAKAYLSGEADIDQVTSEIMSKVNTYLAE